MQNEKVKNAKCLFEEFLNISVIGVYTFLLQTKALMKLGSIPYDIKEERRRFASLRLVFIVICDFNFEEF